MPVITGSEAEVPEASKADTGDRLRAVGVAVGLTVAAVVVSVVTGVATVIPVLLLELDVESTGVFLALVVAGQVGFLAVGYAYARYRDMEIRIVRPGRRELGYAVGGAVAALLLVTVLSVVLAVLDLVPGSALDEAAIADPNVLLGLAALSVVVVAPIEEFVFRGVVQGRLREAFGPVGAVAGASLLFGALHLANYTGALAPVLAGGLLIAITGSVLGVLYERTRNLAVPIVAHALYNVVLLGIAFATV